MTYESTYIFLRNKCDYGPWMGIKHSWTASCMHRPGPGDTISSVFKCRESGK